MREGAGGEEVFWRRGREFGVDHIKEKGGDSEIIIKGLQNNSPPKNPLLLPLHLRLKALVDGFPGDVTLVHVKRALNKRADALAHAASISDDAGFVMQVTPGTLRPTLPPTPSKPPERERTLQGQK